MKTVKRYRIEVPILPEAVTSQEVEMVQASDYDNLAAAFLQLKAEKEPVGEDVLFQVLDATVGIITRRAYPHALESEAWNAGLKVITDRRAGLIKTLDDRS